MKKNVIALLKGKFLISNDSVKNWKFILFASVLAVVMIASSHSVDKKVLEIARLNEEVKELRSEFIDTRFQLQKQKLESTVTSKVKEKGLAPSLVPPKKIKIATQK
ncbi:FtsL-like putative cell division protein [Ascidiimonas sp. W6]|uniref:FtsL-like putative cell division protein n=1 Tax=Ascidiimonas meishanensis TaxID=3128903 RepID=UPI0030EC231D